jgi:CRP-like cAMP-binding protein
MFKRKTDNDTLSATLKHCELFSGLSASEIKSVLAVSHIRDYSEGEKIFSDGTMGLCLYLIVKGSVRILIENEGKTTLLNEFSNGEFFSEVHLFSETFHTVSCAAKEVTRLIVFSKPDIEDLIKIKPRLGNKFLLNFFEFFSRKLDDLYKENRDLKKQKSDKN